MSGEWLRQIGMALQHDPLAVDVPKLHRSALDKLSLTEAAA